MNLVQIEFDRCKECMYCVTFCPKNVLTAGDKINKQGYYTPVVSDVSACTACGTCARMCPEAAIKVIKDAK